VTSPPLQFGERDPALDYRERPAAFGLAERNGMIACVRVERGEESWLDLPGGALDPGESEPAALAREFGEETGLVVEAGDLLVRARQYFVKTDETPVNNVGGIYRVTVTGEDPSLKVEGDHVLVWLDPVEALAGLRHGSHALAVSAWLNRGPTATDAPAPARKPRGARARAGS